MQDVQRLQQHPTEPNEGSSANTGGDPHSLLQQSIQIKDLPKDKVCVVLMAASKSRVQFKQRAVVVPKQGTVAQLSLKLRTFNPGLLQHDEALIWFVETEAPEKKTILIKVIDTLGDLASRYAWKSDGYLHLYYITESAFG